MRVENISKTPRYIVKNDLNKPQAIEETPQQREVVSIPFCAAYNVVPKKFNIDIESSKLLKQINDVLKSDIKEECSVEDLVMATIRQVLTNFRKRETRKEEILDELERLSTDKIMNPQQIYERARVLTREYKSLDKIRVPKEKPAPKPKVDAESVDFRLYHNFKTAIDNDNYNLLNVFREYYSKLGTIKSIDELGEIYPKLKTPPNPQTIIAQKIVKTLGKDFYVGLDNALETGDQETVTKYILTNVLDYSQGIAKKFNIPLEDFFHKIGTSTVEVVCERYASIVDKLNSLPQKVKIKPAEEVNATDIKMLSVDYDDFVLSVLKRQYLEGINPNDIVYQGANGVDVSVSSLKGTPYKFEKISEKLKKLFIDSDKIRFAQTDYENFSTEQFQRRLAYFSAQDFADDARVLEHILDFYSCSFAKGDIPPLIKFLRQLDDIKNGDKTIEQVLETVKAENIKPLGTARLNELELEEQAKLLKQERQLNFELSKLRGDFNDGLDVLYSNNMPSLALTCSKYEPKSLDDRAMVEKIQSIISSNIDKTTKKVLNVKKLQVELNGIDTYNEFLKAGKNVDLLKSARNYAISIGKENDSVTIGRYISNHDIISTYPECLEFVDNPEIISRIMQKTSNNPNEAVKYLCKYEDYQIMDAKDKILVNKILEHFDEKNPVEKSLLKSVIENDYCGVDTVVRIEDKYIDAAICSKAKKEILDKYKFPKCLEYMRAFEEALTSFATSKNSSGIKKTGTNNNALEYKMELKIVGHDDRLFSSNNDYRFDVFSETGLH